MKAQEILNRYPKIRPELPKAYQDIYDLHYKRNRQGKTKATSLSMKMEEWLHKVVAEDVQNKALDTLEIGAGTLNQLDYEKNNAVYDIVEPYQHLYFDSPHLKKIRNIYKDISEVSKENKYDRIIAVATFEHILNLPEVIAHTALLMKENGSLRISIPNEGTIMWKLGTKFTGFEFKKMYGLQYQVLLDHEHVNTADEIETCLKAFYNKVKVRSFGLNRTFSFYRYLECTEPNTEAAKKYLDSL